MDHNKVFKMIFIIVAVMTFISLLFAVVLSILPKVTTEMQSMINTCSNTYQIGFGAICGLLAGYKMDKK